MTQGSNIIVPQRVRLIPMEKVVALMATACSAYELPRSEAQIIDAMLSAFPTATIHDAKFLSYEDVVLFMDNWVRALKTKDFNFLTMKRGKRWELPTVEEIIDSPEYLNQKTQIRPAIKREILRMYENGAYFPEVLLTGATGIGKDYASYIIYGITLMELYSYWNPQIEFGLAAGTSIILAIQSITKELAKQVTFNELVGTVLSNSKFFKEKFPWDKHVTTELRFPNNIYVRPFSGEDTSALGMAIFSCFPPEQQYVCVDGYHSFGDEDTCSVYTSDGHRVWNTEDAVSSTKIKEVPQLVRLWFGDTYIDCTENQKFKDGNNEWVVATDCEGRKLLSYTMSNMWGMGDIHGSASSVGTQNEDKRISGRVPQCSDMQPKNDSQRKREDTTECRACTMSVMRSVDGASKPYTLKQTPSRYYSCRIPKNVSRFFRCYTGGKKAESYFISKAHAPTTRKSGNERETSQTREGGSAYATYSCISKEVGRCLFSQLFIRSSEKKSKKSIYGGKNTAGGAGHYSFPENPLGCVKEKKEEYVSVHRQKRGRGTSPFSDGDCYSFLVRSFRTNVGVRKVPRIHTKTGKLFSVFSRFCSQWHLRRGESRSIYTEQYEDRYTDTGGSQTTFSVNDKPNYDGTLSNHGYCMELANTEKSERDRIHDADGEISSVVCTRVEYITRSCAVYDLVNVPKTNALIVPTKDKSIHLIAHNCIANEMAFMNVVAKSKKAGGQEYNQAARIYRTLSRRIKGRFLKHGKIPGKMILISSANKEGDFMWQRLQEVEAMKPEDKAKVFVMKMSQWASFEGLDRLLPESFLVEKGDGTKQSRIIESRDDAIDPEDVIEVPMDYREEFEKDIDGALADIAGEFIAGGRKKFIPYKEDMAKAIQAHKEANDNTQLFRKEAIIFDKEVDPYNPDYTQIVNMEYIKNILAPSLSYAVHIDYGFTGDGTGVAISHVPHYKLMDKARIYDPVSNGYILQQNLNLPVYHIDGVIQIKASSGSEVDIDFVEGLIYFLKEHINIQWVTFDSYESRASIQGFKKRGIISGVVSTVSNKEPYAELKNAIKTGRIMYPDSSILAKEIRDLERLPDGKIDHPSTGDGSKDCADAVAGTIYVLMRGALKQSSRAQTTRREDTQHQRTPVTQRRSRFSQV